MWGAYEGMGWWLIFGVLSWVLFLGAVIYLSVSMSQPRGKDPTGNETALEVAQRRHASGEISQQEFEEVREELAE